MNTPKRRVGIGDTPYQRHYTINDVRYMATHDLGDPVERMIYRLTAEGDVAYLVGLVFNEGKGCWRVMHTTKCWRSMEQAIIELAKGDQHVNYAR